MHTQDRVLLVTQNTNKYLIQQQGPRGISGTSGSSGISGTSGTSGRSDPFILLEVPSLPSVSNKVARIPTEYMSYLVDETGNILTDSDGNLIQVSIVNFTYGQLVAFKFIHGNSANYINIQLGDSSSYPVVTIGSSSQIIPVGVGGILFAYFTGTEFHLIGFDTNPPVSAGSAGTSGMSSINYIAFPTETEAIFTGSFSVTGSITLNGVDINQSAVSGSIFPYVELTNTAIPRNVEFSESVSFVKSNYGSEVDFITGSVSITRGNTQAIYNPTFESGWDWDTSPSGTLWNSDGWDSLHTVPFRTYTNFYNAVNDSFGDYFSSVSNSFTNRLIRIIDSEYNINRWSDTTLKWKNTSSPINTSAPYTHGFGMEVYLTNSLKKISSDGNRWNTDVKVLGTYAGATVADKVENIIDEAITDGVKILVAAISTISNVPQSIFNRLKDEGIVVVLALGSNSIIPLNTQTTRDYVSYISGFRSFTPPSLGPHTSYGPAVEFGSWGDGYTDESNLHHQSWATATMGAQWARSLEISNGDVKWARNILRASATKTDSIGESFKTTSDQPDVVQGFGLIGPESVLRNDVPRPDIVGKRELIMHIPTSDDYYAVEFTSWASGNSGGSFAYNRYKIDTSFFFSKQAFSTDSDTISEYVTITRGNGGGWIYNTVEESSHNSESPTGTLWNADGWDNLSDLTSRTFTSINNLFGGNFSSITGRELIMLDVLANQYYAIQFLTWGQGSSSGGPFSYVRFPIDSSQVNEGITFADGSVQKTAYGSTRSTFGKWKIEDSIGNATVSFTEFSVEFEQDITLVQSPSPHLPWDIFALQQDYPEMVADINNGNSIYIGQLNDTTYEIYAYLLTVSGTPYIVLYNNNSQEIPHSIGDTINIRRGTGATPVRWFSNIDDNFRGAVINYHAYIDNTNSSGGGTFIGTIHISRDSGNYDIQHSESFSGNTPLRSVADLWHRFDNERDIYFRMLNMDAARLRIHWTAKIFTGPDYYD
jgi:hypothetical protein